MLKIMARGPIKLFTNSHVVDFKCNGRDELGLKAID